MGSANCKRNRRTPDLLQAGVAYYIVSTKQLSHSAALILKALSLGYGFGLEVMVITGLPSGTVYPALRRLERDSLAVSRWESEAEASSNRRPSRRYYEVTAAGKEAAQSATKRFPLLSLLVGKLS